MPRPWPVLLRCGRAGLLFAVAAGCGGAEAPPPRALRLVRPELPADANAPFQANVRLNDELRFVFSDALDRLSVTRESVRIIGDDGRDALGRLEVEGAAVRFVPELPLAPDLTDAGFLPGRRYRVELRGFPAPDGLRSAHGAPLSVGLATAFETVRVPAAGSASGAGVLFTDRLQTRSGLLKFHPPLPARIDNEGVYSIPTTGSIFLVCDKPVDPSTLDPDLFVLVVKNTGARLPLSARLVENEASYSARPMPRALRSRGGVPAGWDELPRAAVIELTPREKPAPGAYCQFSFKVDARGELGLCDFNGKPLKHTTYRPIPIWFQVRLPESDPGAYSEDFLRTPRGSLRAQVAVPGFDGTAAWSDTGRVEVRYPAAAGTGRDGVVELGTGESRADVQAVRLHLAKDLACDLGSAPGTRVLRAQGAIVIEGELVRRGAETSAEHLKAYEPELFADAPASAAALTLSRWLARAQDAARAPAEAGEGVLPPSWTVLVAGGDLTIDGRIEVDGPVLLCAGGMLRIAGQVRGAQSSEIGQVWILGEGGGLAVHPPPNLVRQALTIDAPVGPNPLREPLRLCVRSQGLPLTGAAVHWLSAEARGSDAARNGKWSVHYLAAGALAAEGDLRARWVDDPALIPAAGDGWSGPLVYFVELEVPVGGPWAPPFLDALRLQWEERGR
ncbi:MAG: hypothetical protein HZA53_03735 [Planctomycetes bacterium]|nr:hypothetical protein [Planctomycetota bacterium]